MMVVIGIAFALACVFGSYFIHGGKVGIFIDAWTEFMAIGGGSIGIFVAANGIKVTKGAIATALGLLKGNPYSKKGYLELLVMLYQMFSVARRDGLLGLESHFEDPSKSPIMGKNHLFMHGNHHSCDFFCDTLKVIVSGGVQPHSLDEMMEMDLDIAHHEEAVISDALQNAGDAMPAVGIVACVLGVIITMGKIGGDPAEIGLSIALALVGTFLGIMLAYLLVFPTVRAVVLKNRSESQYMNCIRHAIFSFARGEPPITCVEFARRNIDPSERPGFDEVDKAVKAAKNG